MATETRNNVNVLYQTPTVSLIREEEFGLSLVPPPLNPYMPRTVGYTLTISPKTTEVSPNSLEGLINFSIGGEDTLRLVNSPNHSIAPHYEVSIDENTPFCRYLGKPRTKKLKSYISRRQEILNRYPETHNCVAEIDKIREEFIETVYLYKLIATEMNANLNREFLLNDFTKERHGADRERTFIGAVFGDICARITEKYNAFIDYLTPKSTESAKYMLHILTSHDPDE